MFKIKMRIFDFIQNFLLFFGIYLRPRRLVSHEFVNKFLKPKNIGLELIMIGDGKDGSYVLPNDLENIKYCFSPGVGPTSQFEIGLYDHYGIKSFLIDASITDVPSDRTDFYDFEQKFLGASTYGNTICLSDWVSDKLIADKSQDYILQMDIEGAEYASLLASDDETLTRFRIILLEIHYLDLLNTQVFGMMIEQLFRKLSRNFVVCFARANDCCGSVSIGNDHSLPRVMEVTLTRKDRINHISNDPIPKFNIRNI